MIKINNFEVKNNFWESNSNFLIVEDFKELYNSDKSKNKKDSSNTMWAISLLLHPDSILFNLDYSYRKTVIQGEYFNKNSFSWESIDDLVAAYKKLVLTSAQRQLVEWSRIMDEKSQFLSKLKYNEENWEMIEKMLKSNKDLYSELERITDMLERSDHEGDVKGGAEESASEKGLI